MVLRYFLKTLLLPPCSLLLLLLAAWLFRRRWPRVATLAVLSGFLGLWLLSTPLVATQLAASLERYPALAPEQIGSLPARAIVILSSGQNDTTREFGQPVSKDQQLARLRYGVFLARHTGLPVLVTGGSALGTDLRSGAATMAFDLELFGVKPTWLETRSRTTAENGDFSFQMLAPENRTSILLVTSATHMLRAKWSFERSGFTVIPAPTMFIDRSPVTMLSFLPQAESLALSSQALHEWLGYWTYRLMGW